MRFSRISNDIKRIFDNSKRKTDLHAETPSKQFYVEKYSLCSIVGCSVLPWPTGFQNNDLVPFVGLFDKRSVVDYALVCRNCTE